MLLLLYFAATLFVSATLLFLVQPMVGKMILPRLGGTPAVWTTCMVFFQAVLLIGYGYTHSLSRVRNRRVQLLIHLVILVLPFAFFLLPFSLSDDWQPADTDNPVFDVLWLLLGMVGLPFFVVATSAPLLQKWFGDTGHEASKDPYFLYGASNLGSMLALVLYPLAMEPLFAVHPPPDLALRRQQIVSQAEKFRDKAEGELSFEERALLDKVESLDEEIQEQSWLCQTRFWMIGYGLLMVMVAGCVVIVWKAPAGTKPAVVEPAVAEVPKVVAPVEQRTAIQPSRKIGRSRGGKSVAVPAPSEEIKVATRAVTWPRRIRWIFLAAAPSSLMLGVTTHLTTDIAAIPFFWVIPLALYLFTFILVFSNWVVPVIGSLLTFSRERLRKPVAWTDEPHTIVLYVQPFVLGGLVLMISVGQSLPYTWMTFGFHVLVFFLTALMCHGELAKDRPGTAHLTEFYLWMSVGGVLGGLFNGLFAPKFFQVGVLEYPIAMVFACILRPRMLGEAVFIPGDTDKYKVTTLGRAVNLFMPFLMALLTCAVLFLIPPKYYFGVPLQFYGRAFVLVLVLSMFGRPFRFAMSLGVFMLIVFEYERRIDALVFQARSFFGFVRVQEKGEKNLAAQETGPRFYSLLHGGINHGQQNRARVHRRDPITYFHPTGGIGQVFSRFTWPVKRGPGAEYSWPDYHLDDNQYHWPDTRLPASLVGLGASPWDAALGACVNTQSEPPFAVIGLGIGQLAAHAKPFQRVRFFEIDPLVKRLSEPSVEIVNGERVKLEPLFTFVKDAVDRDSDIEVEIGDGRLLLQKEPKHYYHIIVIDAFSSDAIPVHLLTREALEMYLDKLAEGGVLVFNTTNRYVELTGVLRDLADKLKLTCYHFGDHDSDEYPTRFASDWLVMQRRGINPHGPRYNGGPLMPPLLLDAEGNSAWKIPNPLGGPVWTDRYSNLLRRGVMRWGQ